MNIREIKEEIERILSVMPQIQAPATKMNLQIMLAMTNGLEMIRDAIGEMETRENEPAVRPEEI